MTLRTNRQFHERILLPPFLLQRHKNSFLMLNLTVPQSKILEVVRSHSELCNTAENAIMPPEKTTYRLKKSTDCRPHSYRQDLLLFRTYSIRSCFQNREYKPFLSIHLLAGLLLPLFLLDLLRSDAFLGQSFEPGLIFQKQAALLQFPPRVPKQQCRNNEISLLLNSPREPPALLQWQ